MQSGCNFVTAHSCLDRHTGKLVTRRHTSRNCSPEVVPRLLVLYDYWYSLWLLIVFFNRLFHWLCVCLFYLPLDLGRIFLRCLVTRCHLLSQRILLSHFRAISHVPMCRFFKGMCFPVCTQTNRIQSMFSELNWHEILYDSHCQQCPSSFNKVVEVTTLMRGQVWMDCNSSVYVD